MKAVKIYDQDGNKSVGIYTDGDKYLAMTYSQSKEFKTLASAERWISKYL